MKVEIDLNDYISDDEKLELIREAYTDYIRPKIAADYERILFNAAYRIVFKAVDDEMNGDLKEVLKNKVISVIDNLGPFEVLGNRYSDVKISVAQQYLNEAVIENKNAIYDKVKKVVNENLDSLINEDNGCGTAKIIEDVVSQVIYEKLTK